MSLTFSWSLGNKIRCSSAVSPCTCTLTDNKPLACVYYWEGANHFLLGGSQQFLMVQKLTRCPPLPAHAQMMVNRWLMLSLKRSLLLFSWRSGIRYDVPQQLLFCIWTCSTDGKPQVYVTLKTKLIWSIALCTCCTCQADEKPLTNGADLLYILHTPILWKPLASGSEVISLGGLELSWIDPWQVLLHMPIWWKALANGTYVTWLGGLSLSWIVPWPMPSVAVAHAHLTRIAGKRSWCWLPGRLGTNWILPCLAGASLYLLRMPDSW